MSRERVPQNRNVTAVFDVQRPFQFLTFNIHFVRKNCGGHLKIAILPKFWTSDVHEMLRLSRFVALRRHRPRLKEIERRARERKEERERRSADVKVRGSRSADVKLWRCRSADVKVGSCKSADVKVWRCRSADVKVFFYEEPFAGALGKMESWDM